VNLTADLATRLKSNGNLVDQCADFVRNCNQKIDVIPDSTSKTIKDIRKEIKDHDLIVTKADKGNSVVILKRSDYRQKILEFLNSNNATQCDTFSFSKLNDKVRAAIHGSKYICK